MKKTLAMAVVFVITTVSQAENWLEIELPAGQTVSKIYYATPACREIPYQEFLSRFAQANGIENSDRAYRRLRPGSYRFPISEPIPEPVVPIIQTASMPEVPGFKSLFDPILTTAMADSWPASAEQKTRQELTELNRLVAEQAAQLKELEKKNALLQRLVKNQTEELKILAQNQPVAAPFNHQDDERPIPVWPHQIIDSPPWLPFGLAILAAIITAFLAALHRRRTRDLQKSIRQLKADQTVFKKMVKPFYYDFHLADMKPATVYLRYGDTLPNGRKTVIIPGIDCLVPAEPATIEAMLRAATRDRSYPISLPPWKTNLSGESAPVARPLGAKAATVERRRRILKRVTS